VSSVLAYEGSHSLAIKFNSSTGGNIKVPLCPPNGLVSLLNMNLSAQVLFSGDGGQSVPDQSTFLFYGPDTGTLIGGLYRATVVSPEWMNLTASDTNAPGKAIIGISFGFAGPWSGTVYIDNIQVTH